MTKDFFPDTLGRDDVYIIRTLDGSNTLFSRRSNATYHSVKGAVSESRHVFIQNGLKVVEAPFVRVLEIGFGTGLNAFLSFLYSRTGKFVSYTAIETHPLDQEIIRTLDYPEYLSAHKWDFIFNRMHEEQVFQFANFVFRKQADIPGDLEAFDCIFFDAFSPDIDPGLWETDLLKSLFDLTAPGGYFVTYCAKGDVRRKLTETGYIVERLPGAPGKLHMLRGRKATK